jgi:hypothetical protein
MTAARKLPVKASYTFGHAGYLCRIALHRHSACGYVIIPAEHPWHGLQDSALHRIIRGADETAMPPGGITYAKLDGQAWRIGFDCYVGTPPHELVEACERLAHLARIEA